MENNGPAANKETQWYQKFFVKRIYVYITQYPIPNTWYPIPITQYPLTQNQLITRKIQTLYNWLVPVNSLFLPVSSCLWGQKSEGDKQRKIVSSEAEWKYIAATETLYRKKVQCLDFDESK